VCRHLAYIGPPIRLAAVLYDPPFSLVHQSWAPRRQRHGVVNADGYGVGWYAPEVRREPARYRRAGPIWADRSLASLAGVVTSGCLVAAVRSATPPWPAEASGAAPFTAGPWLFSLNGAVADDLVALRRKVADRWAAGIEGASDAEVVFALLLDRLNAGCDPGEALAWCVGTISGRLNLLLSDGQGIWATAWGDTLSWRNWSGGVVIASEPFDDDDDWVPIPDRSLVVADARGCHVHPIGSGRESAAS
jgi:gamma-glutamyl hercynylcysteine S-oxide hydrolase